MHFKLGAKISGFLERHPIGKSKPNPEGKPGKATTSTGKSGFEVLGRAQHPQAGTRPQAGAVPAPPTGWSTSTVGLQYPTHTGPALARTEGPRSGSPLIPNGIQYAQFGGSDESLPHGPLRVMNPGNSPSESPASSRSSTPSSPNMPLPFDLPASLTPGMGSAPRIPLSADLTFEQPTSSSTQHPPSLTPGMGAAPRVPLSADLTFEQPTSYSTQHPPSPTPEMSGPERRRPMGPRAMNPRNG